MSLTKGAKNLTTKAAVTEHHLASPAGIVLQVGLGILLAVSTVRRGDILADDFIILLGALLAVLVASALHAVPRPQLHFSKFLTWLGGAALTWYIVYAVMSWQRYIGSFLLENDGAGPHVQIAVIAVAGSLVAAVLLLAQSQRLRDSVTSIPWWTVGLLAVSFAGLAANAQLGYVPVYLLVLLISFYAGFLCGSPRVLLFTTVAVGFVFSALALITFVSAATDWHWLGFHWFVNRLSMFRLGGLDLPTKEHGLTFVHPTVAGAYMVVLIALSLAARNYLTRRTAFAATLIAGFAAVLLLMTQSRAAIVGLAVMFGVYALLQGRRRFGSRPVMLLLAAVMAGAFVLMSVERFPDGERLAMARVALGGFADSPLIGQGTNGFAPLWHQYSVSHNMWNAFMGHSHNIVTQVLCDQGLVGLFSLALLGFLILRQMRGIRQRLSDESDRRAFGCTVAGMTGFFVTGLFIPTWVHPPMKAIMPALIGVWWGTATCRRGHCVGLSSKSMAHLSKPAAVALLAVAAAVGAWHVRPANLTISEIMTHDWTRTLHLGLGRTDERYASVCGTVTYADGKPVAGARLVLSPGELVCNTGIDGDFRLSKVPFGNYRLEIEHSSGGEQMAVPVKAKVVTQVDVSLRRHSPTSLPATRALSARIVDAESGKPAEQAHLLLEPTNQVITCKADGSCATNVSAVLPYRVTVFSPGYLSTSRESSAGKAPLQIDFRLIPKKLDLVDNGDFFGGFSDSGVALGWTAWEADWSKPIKYDSVPLPVVNKSGTISELPIQRFSREDGLRAHGGIVQTVATVAGVGYSLQGRVWFRSADSDVWCEVGYDCTGQRVDGEARTIKYTKLEEHGQRRWISFDIPFAASSETTSIFIKSGHYSEDAKGAFECRVAGVHLVRSSL